MDVSELDITRFLSEDEKNLLDHLNLTTNSLQQKIKRGEDALNMSLRELFKNWSKKMKNILTDIVTEFHLLGEGTYSKYFTDIDNTSNWLGGIGRIIKNFAYIFIKENRTIYVGITVIIIAFLLFAFQISS